MTYAVVWREKGGSDCSGRLELHDDGIVLAGSAADRRVVHRDLTYENLVTLHIERSAHGGRAGRPRLVLLMRGNERIEIASLEGLGALHELADHLAARGKAAA